MYHRGSTTVRLMVNGQSGRNIRNVTKANAVTERQVVVEVATIRHQPTVEKNVLVVYMNVKDVFLKQVAFIITTDVSFLKNVFITLKACLDSGKCSVKKNKSAILLVKQKFHWKKDKVKSFTYFIYSTENFPDSKQVLNELFI